MSQTDEKPKSLDDFMSTLADILARNTLGYISDHKMKLDIIFAMNKAGYIGYYITSLDAYHRSPSELLEHYRKKICG